MQSPLPVFINGRFMGQPVTGLQRYAFEVSRRLTDPDNARDFDIGSIRFLTTQAENPGWVRRNIWEQADLLAQSFRGVLFSPCNVGPWLHPNHLVVMHDIRVFAKGHTRAFPGTTRAYLRASCRVLSKTAKRILTVSDYSKSRIIETFGVAEEKVTVVYPGADHVLGVQPDEDVIHRLKLGHRKYILAVNSLMPHKNLAILHSINWKKYDLQLCIVGGAPEKWGSTLQQIVERNIIYAGRISDSEVKALYTHALAYIFPSLYEGFGIPPLEAMHCGCPVIASNRTSIPEVCGDAALYFDPTSTENLQLEVERILLDEKLREGLIYNGHQRAQLFRWDTTAKRIASTIKKLQE